MKKYRYTLFTQTNGDAQKERHYSTRERAVNAAMWEEFMLFVGQNIRRGSVTLTEDGRTIFWTARFLDGRVKYVTRPDGIRTWHQVAGEQGREA